MRTRYGPIPYAHRWAAHMTLAMVLCLSGGAACTAAPGEPDAPAPDSPASPVRPAAPATAAPIDRSHRLGPGDVLEISVNALPEFTRTARLFADGSFDFPLAGRVQASGLTVDELTARMQELLKSELRQPCVTVLLREVYRREAPRVTVLGAVAKKGEMEWPAPKPLRALLALAEPTETADLAAILIRSPDGAERKVDFSPFSATGQATGDLLLNGGEEVIVLELPTAPKLEVATTVLGAVQKPGSVVAPAGTSILDILEKAGGALPGADLSRVTVKGAAHPSPLTVNVARHMAGDTAAGYRVQSGDEVIVPRKPLRVYVLGEVQRQGELAIESHERVLDVLLQVGTTPNADPARAELIRRNPDGKPTTQKVNLKEAMKGGARYNLALQPEDVLFIPSKRAPKRGLVEYLGPLLTLGGIFAW